MFEYYAGWATKISGDIPPVGPDAMSLIVKEPVGVCGLIVPWNYPMLMAAQKVAPALAAGCTVVLKPAEQTPLTALAHGRDRRGGRAARPACSTSSPGSGRRPAAPLLDAPAASTRSRFTGSKEVGQLIMRTCADQLKRVTLELGGKSPNIVFADADLDRGRARAPRNGIFGNQGEVCSAGQPGVRRSRSIYDDVLQAHERLRRRHQASARGSTPTTTMGPLVSAAAARPGAGRTSTIGPAEGATLAFEGAAPDRPGAGRRLLRAADDLRGAIQRPAHRPRGDLRPGHGGHPVHATSTRWSRWRTTPSTASPRRSGPATSAKALRTARAVRAGVVWINDSQPAPSETMWGGYKQSGIGRELGPYALDAYLETKQIYINLG